MPHNDSVIKTLDYRRKVAAEEVLHKDPKVRILPTQPVPDELPPIEGMIPILHKTCGEIAFYYTHVPVRGEMMMSTRARDNDGNILLRGTTMRCTSCGEHIESAGHLQVRKEDYEAAR